MQYILRTAVDSGTYREICDRIQFLAQSKQSSYVVAANVHVVTTGYRRRSYQEVLDKATIVTPDGMPLVLGMRWLSGKNQERIYGPNLMLAWCERASRIGLSIYLYGSTSKTLELLSQNIQHSFPQIEIAGIHSPPFRILTQEEEESDVERIHESGASVVFVGLGCPKQEEWMYRQLGRLNAVMIGVGAAFQFHSGEVAQAPRWMMRFGLEWLFRLSQEPERLWSRYLLTNSTFLFLFSCQLLKHTMSSFINRFNSACTTLIRKNERIR